MAPKPEPSRRKIVAENRRRASNISIEDTFEAGIALTGTEVKSLRFGQATIAEAYAGERSGEDLCSFNANIPEYLQAIASTTSPSGRASCCCTSARSRS